TGRASRIGASVVPAVSAPAPDSAEALGSRAATNATAATPRARHAGRLAGRRVRRLRTTWVRLRPVASVVHPVVSVSCVESRGVDLRW
ncbi:MAG: hypothetical protein ACHQNA_05980, partial [Acidimicrobiales bacterium]